MPRKSVKSKPSTASSKSTVHKPVYIASVIVSLIATVYVSFHTEPCLYSVFVKILPCAFLFCFMALKHKHDKSIATFEESCCLILGTGDRKGKKRNQEASGMVVGICRGLIFSMVGDAFLVWHDDEMFFLAGMAAFGVAQLFYISGCGFGHISYKNGLGVYILLTLLASVLLSSAPPLFKKVVPFYAILLATTLWRAVDRLGAPEGPPHSKKLLTVGGCILFCISDGCIGLFRFLLPSTDPITAQFIILSTYFAAQCLLVAGA